MKKKLAFVLSGGGARGALQVGALRALLEAGLQPDVLVGTSIGAANAAFLAWQGVNQEGVRELVKVWRDASLTDLLPSNYLWLTVRRLFNRPDPYSSHRMRDFCVHHRLTPDLCFQDIQGVELLLVAADLNSGRPILYGLDPSESVLEGVLASTALPPWVTPIHKEGQLLVDGGVVSNLPIEPALMAGVTEIIALDLTDPREVLPDLNGFGPFVGKLVLTVQQRQAELEIALAEACGVTVRYVPLVGPEPVPVWDFRSWEELVVTGYNITRQHIAAWPAEKQPVWQRLFRGSRKPTVS